MFGRKSDAYWRGIIDGVHEEYLDLLADLVVIYPQIRDREWTTEVRVEEIKIAADAIRAAKKDTQAVELILEFRGLG